MTVTLKVWVAPKQVPKVGATLMVAVCGSTPGAWLLKLMLDVAPFAAKPMAVLLLVHAYCVPEGPLKVTAMGKPAHLVMSLMGLRAGTGFAW